MIPIHTLLARIRWDPEFGRGRWEIAYLDKTRPALVRLPFGEIRTQRHIGFVRQVFRDGKLVWSRLAPRMCARQRDNLACGAECSSLVGDMTSAVIGAATDRPRNHLKSELAWRRNAARHIP